MNKVIIFSAPSGSGKTTIMKAILAENKELEFSISATSRASRTGEQDGKDYYFLTAEDFRQKIANNEFIEWEEVYEGTYYGTLKSEVERIWQNGKNVIFDIDVVGGVNIKNMYAEKALAVFIQPPSVEELRKRLVSRGTDSAEAIEKRVNKAEEELSYAPKFDCIVVNDELDKAIEEVRQKINDFLQ